MVIVEVCVGSSCHIKGAPEIVSLLQQKVQENGLDGEVVLTGSFCTGRCNRVGVTVSVNDDRNHRRYARQFQRVLERQGYESRCCG